MVRREPCYLKAWITNARAHIVHSQMARTLLCSRLLPDTVRSFSFWQKSCSLLPVSACLSIPSWTAGCQGLAALRGMAHAPNTRSSVEVSMKYLSCTFPLDPVCHHSPYKTSQFPCNCCHCDTFLFPFPDKMIVSTSHPSICLVCIGYDCRWISILSCL